MTPTENEAPSQYRADAEERLTYVQYDEESLLKHQNLKTAFIDTIESVSATLANGRAKSLVITHLEEAFAWVGKSIRDEQVSRGSTVADVPQRTNA